MITDRDAVVRWLNLIAWAAIGAGLHALGLDLIVVVVIVLVGMHLPASLVTGRREVEGGR